MNKGMASVALAADDDGDNTQTHAALSRMSAGVATPSRMSVGVAVK